ncbi:MAG: FHA domain-containing protein, partial [Candidatus Melainabacteria bacterium]|nr:FHA domain-containing protein [Candidatus Melainabacteria bacterium]
IKLHGVEKIPVVVMLEQGGAAAGNDGDDRVLQPAGGAALAANGEAGNDAWSEDADAWKADGDDDRRFPLRIFHLVDVSGSMDEQADWQDASGETKLGLVQRTIKNLSQKLPEGIRHILIPYSSYLSRDRGDYDRAERLVTAVQKLNIEGGTRIELATEEALRMIQAEPDSPEGIKYRNLISLISDGENNSGNAVVLASADKYEQHNAAAFNLGVGTHYNEALMYGVLEQAGSGLLAHIPQKGQTSVDVFAELLPNYVTQIISAPFYPIISFNKWFDSVVNMNPSIRAAKVDYQNPVFYHKAAVGYQHKGFAVGFIDKDKLDQARVHSILKESADTEAIDTEELEIKDFDPTGLFQDAELIKRAPLEALKVQMLKENNPQAIQEFLDANPDLDAEFRERLEQLSASLQSYQAQGDINSARTAVSSETAVFGRDTVIFSPDMPGMMPAVPDAETAVGAGANYTQVAAAPPPVNPHEADFSDPDSGVVGEIKSDSDIRKQALRFEKIAGQGLFVPRQPGAVEDFLIGDNQELIIGRSNDVDIQIRDSAASREHCILSWHEGKLLLRDLASANGTLLNTEDIQADEVRVQDKDIIQICGEKFRVHF